MTADPVTVAPTATVKDIAEVMLDRDVGSVPVVDIGGVLVGIVSEGDLVCREGYPTARHHYLSAFVESARTEHRHHWAQRAEGLTAGEIMTTDLVTCHSDELLPIVTRRMLSKEVRAMPVVDEGRLVGILARHDLLSLFDRPDREVAAAVDQLLADPLWSPEGHAVKATVVDGVVTLTGTVRQDGDGHTLHDVVLGLPGVISVVDRTTVGAPAGPD
jgi:CBS domain-containing protein